MPLLKTLAFVTGANSGIGRATAEALAREPYNYHVILGARDVEAGERIAANLREEGCAACCVQLDLTNPESVDAAVRFVRREFGYLDVLVNNAGVLLDFADQALGIWAVYQRTFATNVIGPSILTEYLIPLLKKSKNAPPRIVFVSCGMGCLSLALNERWPYYNVETKVYDASKSAVNMIMLNFARILTKGKVNAVCPGQSRTKLTGNFGRSPEIAAEPVIRMATIDRNGPTGTFMSRSGKLPW